MAGVRWSWIVAALAFALVAGCGDDDDKEPAAAATTAATETPAPTATPEQVGEVPDAPRARKVRFRATDGEPVRGAYVPAGRNAPAVVLLHEIRGGVDQWAPLVPFLHKAGFATLAYQSRGSAMESERLPDAIGAVRWLRSRPDVDPKRLAMVGASIGASTTVLAMATQARADVDAAVALSPPDSGDIWALQDDDRYRPHDLLLIADESESSSAEGMLDGAVRSRFMQSEGPGHGVALLPERDVHDALLAWLDDRVR
jgi:hypothetical protein